MKTTTLCLCLKNNSVLLSEKLIGFGAGKINGYGGKVLEEETPAEAAVRELFEESALSAKPEDLVQVGLVRFYFSNLLKFECHVYTLQTWQGEPTATDEMGAPTWYPINSLPTEKMWVADALWFPLVLQGQSIDADVYFNEDGSSVENFTYVERTFG